MLESLSVLNVKGGKMNNEIKKSLQLTCPTCFSVFQLLEVHQQGNHPCREDCQHQWQALLNQHYQEQIILHLAQQEKENHD